MGYTLADGSESTQYKVGDKFVVVDTGDRLATTLQHGQVVTLSCDDKTSCPYFNDDNLCVYWYRLKPYTNESAKQKLEQLLSTRGEEVIEWLTEKLKEFDKQQNIQKELEFAKAKRERLDRHISVLEGKLR